MNVKRKRGAIVVDQKSRMTVLKLIAVSQRKENVQQENSAILKPIICQQIVMPF